MLESVRQPRLKVGIVYTRRDSWMNKATERNKNEAKAKIETLCLSSGVEAFSSDELEAHRRRRFISGREILQSNNQFLSSYADALDFSAFFREKSIDALVFVFANYGQEEAVAKLAADLKVPVLIWGPRDTYEDAESVYRSTDTQCGIFAATKALRRYGVTFSYIENCDVGSDIFSHGLTHFFQVARVVRNFSKARIAQVSVRPQQFLNLMVNEGELLERFGTEIVPITGSELLDTISLVEKKHQADIDELLSTIEPRVDLSRVPDKRKMAAIELGFASVASRYGCNAIASDCWQVIQREHGFGPWFVFGDLYDRGLPCTNECDIHGAITSLFALGALNNQGAAFLTDLTMRHPTEDNTELLWHMAFAKQLASKDSEAYVTKKGEHINKIRNGSLSLLRFDGDHGDYYLFAGCGESVDGPPVGGSYTYLKVENWAKWERKFVHGPYVHHVVGLFGDHRKTMEEACRYLEITFDSPDTDLFIH
jgi:L-fucose isomerase-like protein